MISIPKKGTPEREELIRLHRECVDSMKGVAGFSVLKCGTPGDTTVVSGGVHEHPVLRRVLLRTLTNSVYIRAKPSSSTSTVTALPSSRPKSCR